MACAALLAAIASRPLSAGAEPPRPISCSSEISRENLVPCVIRASPLVREREHTREALRGRRAAVEPLLPSNPVLALTAGTYGSGANGGGPIWSASLGQELEIAGQRDARLRAADEDLRAQENRIVLSQRDVAAAAWEAFYEVVASDEEIALTGRLEEASRRVDSAARTMADKGVLSPLDADVAQASTVRITEARLAAERRSLRARATLASMLGRDPAAPDLVVRGDLSPLPVADAIANAGHDTPPSALPEVQSILADQKALEARTESLRRARIPNITATIFAENDVYNDKVIGVGLSVPIPLPQPVGRTYAGEIRETEALAARTGASAEKVSRDIALERANARAAYLSRTAELRAFAPDQIVHAEQSLLAIAGEIEDGHLGVRDATLAEQTLIGLLLAHIDAKRNVCLAAIALARAEGVSLEAGER